MNQQFSYRQPQQHNIMTNEQFQQIVESILNGKYSWACVLILRFAGYNPLHYIPYRTYNRLIKDNCNSSGNKSNQHQIEIDKTSDDCQSEKIFTQKKASSFEDLSYLEELHSHHQNIIGGSWL